MLFLSLFFLFCSSWDDVIFSPFVIWVCLCAVTHSLIGICWTILASLKTKSTWSWCIIFQKHFWILFANILLKKFLCLQISCFCCCFQVKTSQGHLGRGIFNWGYDYVRLTNRQTCVDIYLINDWCLTVAGITFGHLILGDVWKQTEQGIENKPGSSVPPWSTLQFLPWLPSVIEHKL